MESIDDLLHRRIESTVKLLQLPLTDEEIARGVDKLASNIPDGLTGREIDYAYQLETSFTEWNESGVPDSILKDAVRLLLEDTEVSKRGSGFNSDAYFGLLHGLLPEKQRLRAPSRCKLCAVSYLSHSSSQVCSLTKRCLALR